MNLLNVQEEATTLVKQAGEMLVDNFNSETVSSHSKGGMDFVTEADIEVDRFLKEKLEKMFPTSEVLTEETAPTDYSFYSDKEYLWIIDPIDGTTNFSRNNPHFAVSVALVSRGNPLVGIVFLPIEKKLYTAVKNANALCNGHSIQTSEISDLKKASVATDWAWGKDDREKNYKHFGNVFANIRQPLSLGCASADICLVAEGKLDGYFIFGTKPWDHAAASLVLTQAGGRVTKVTGEKWNVFEPDVLATNGVIHTKFLKLLQ